MSRDRIELTAVRQLVDSDLSDFSTYWARNHEADPDSFPLEMPYPDWLDAHRCWVEAGRPDVHHKLSAKR